MTAAQWTAIAFGAFAWLLIGLVIANHLGG